jgi:hypothetical protein
MRKNERERLARRKQRQDPATELVKYLLDGLKARGEKGCPAIIFVDTVGGKMYPFDTIDEFERMALANDDEVGIHMVHSAVAAHPGQIVVYTVEGSWAS